MGQARVVHHPLLERIGPRVGVPKQLEDELALAQVHGFQPDRLREPEQLRSHLVGGVELAPELEAEHLHVEPAGPVEVGDAVAHMIEHGSHGGGSSRTSVIGKAPIVWPSDVAHESRTKAAGKRGPAR